MKTSMLALSALLLAVPTLQARTVCAAPKTARVTLSYEPAVVTLAGRVSARAYGGAPNYDAKSPVERGSYLMLDRAVRVKGTPGDDFNSQTETVRVLQLGASDDALLTALRRARLHRQRVSLTGTLFHAHTGHHHTAVVMDVTSVRVLSARRKSR